MNDETQDTQAWLGEYLRHLAHDLSAPVRHVVSFSDLLAQHTADSEDEKLLKYLDFIQQGGKRMQSMLQSAQKYGRLQSLAVEPIEIDTQKLCETIWKDSIAHDFVSAKLDATGANCSITMDAEHAKILFKQLLQNAAYYGRNNAKVTVSCEKSGSETIIKITDSGDGFEEANLERALLLYTRFQPSEYPEGNGAGLAYVQAIMQRLNGKIEYQRTPSCFTLTLPA